MILEVRLVRTLMAGLAAAALSLGAVAAGPVPVPLATPQDADDWCDRGRDDDEDRFCEVREFTLAADRGTVEVDAAPNGGIRVEAWDRDEILLLAKVEARADSESEARSLAGEVEVITSGTIRARGPRTRRGDSWYVSYRLHVPRRSDLDLESVNGGIRIAGVEGDIRFRTTNGGIRLSGVAGDVQGSTTNGGVSVELSGDGWEGRGLDVETTNGSVKIAVPEGYSAKLESGTVNGSLRFDFPVTLQGRVRRHFEVDLGAGGTKLRAVTTNGSVVIERA